MRTKLSLALLLIFNLLSITSNANGLNAAFHGLACDIPSGLTVTNLTDASATLSWNAVGGATQYTVEVQDEQVNPSVFHLETNVGGTSYDVSGLTAGTLYKFKVRTRCGGDKSDWSDWMFFKAGTGSTGGGTGTCLPPTSLSAVVNGNSTTLSWNKMNGAIQYYLEIEDEQNVPSTFHVEVTVQDTFYVLTGLQTNVSYKFKVRTHCGAEQSDWSGWSFFNGNSGSGTGGGNGNCSTPTNTSVANITAHEALLFWTAVPGVGSYFLEIEREQVGTPAWQITQTVTTNSFLLTGLVAGAKYKFKVRSNCTGGGNSDWTKFRKFKTAQSLTGTPGASSMTHNSVDFRSNNVSPATEKALQVVVFPNPVQTNASVQLQNLNVDQATLYLFDLAGRKVLEQRIFSETGMWEGSLPFGDLSNGLYLLKIQSGADSKTIKLLVSH